MTLTNDKFNGTFMNLPPSVSLENSSLEFSRNDFSKTPVNNGIIYGKVMKKLPNETNNSEGSGTEFFNFEDLKTRYGPNFDFTELKEKFNIEPIDLRAYDISSFKEKFGDNIDFNKLKKKIGKLDFDALELKKIKFDNLSKFGKFKKKFKKFYKRYTKEITIGIIIFMVFLILIIIISIIFSNPSDTTSSSNVTRKIINKISDFNPQKYKSCSIDSDCNSNESCHQNLCKIKLSEQCSIDNDCMSGSCLNNQCVEQGTGKLNNKCQFINNGYKCNDGLVCNDGICAGQQGFYEHCDDFKKYCSSGLSCLNIDLGTKCKGNNSCICDFNYENGLTSNISCILGMDENKEAHKCLNTKDLPCGSNSSCSSGTCNMGQLTVAKINFGNKLIGSKTTKIEPVKVENTESVGKIKRVTTYEIDKKVTSLILSDKGIYTFSSHILTQKFNGDTLKVNGDKFVIEDLVSNGMNTFILVKNHKTDLSKVFILENSKFIETNINPKDMVPYNSLSGIQYHNDENDFKEIEIKGIDVNDNNILILTSTCDKVYIPQVSKNYVYEQISQTDNIDNIEELAVFLYSCINEKVTSSIAKFYDNINNNNYSYIHDKKIVMKGDFEFSSLLTRYLSVYDPIDFSSYYSIGKNGPSNISVFIIAKDKKDTKSLFISNSDPRNSKEMKFANIAYNVDDSTNITVVKDLFLILSNGSCK